MHDAIGVVRDGDPPGATGGPVPAAIAAYKKVMELEPSEDLRNFGRGRLDHCPPPPPPPPWVWGRGAVVDSKPLLCFRGCSVGVTIFCLLFGREVFLLRPPGWPWLASGPVPLHKHTHSHRHRPTSPPPGAPLAIRSFMIIIYYHFYRDQYRDYYRDYLLLLFILLLFIYYHFLIISAAALSLGSTPSPFPSLSLWGAPAGIVHVQNEQIARQLGAAEPKGTKRPGGGGAFAYGPAKKQKDDAFDFNEKWWPSVCGPKFSSLPLERNEPPSPKRIPFVRTAILATKGRPGRKGCCLNAHCAWLGGGGLTHPLAANSLGTRSESDSGSGGFGGGGLTMRGQGWGWGYQTGGRAQHRRLEVTRPLRTQHATAPPPPDRSRLLSCVGPLYLFSVPARPPLTRCLLVHGVNYYRDWF